jgi:hypothetical protein
MSDDDTKALILARRARFVAMAVAGISMSGCKDDAQPQVCLSVVDSASRGTSTAPTVCLTFAAPEPPPPAEAAQDAGPPDAGPRPRPTVCLSPVRPKDPR